MVLGLMVAVALFFASDIAADYVEFLGRSFSQKSFNHG